MTWLSIILQSKAIKMGGIAVGSSGLIALLLGVVDHKEKSIREMVRLKNNVIMSEVNGVHNEIKNVKAGQKEIKSILIRIDDRVYDLNKKYKQNK